MSSPGTTPWRAARAWFVALAGSLLLACGGVDTDELSAGVAAFHAQYDAEDFDAIRAGATQAFRDQGTAAEFREYLGDLRRRLGPFQRSEVAQLRRVSTGCSGGSVTLIQRAEFAYGAGLETFVFVREDGELRLQRYSLQPRATRRGPATIEV